MAVLVGLGLGLMLAQRAKSLATQSSLAPVSAVEARVVVVAGPGRLPVRKTVTQSKAE